MTPWRRRGPPVAAAPPTGAAASVGPLEQRSDAELLRLHTDGDREAFGVLFARHRDRLWAVALRTVADPEEAADALQEAMISAFRRAGGFRGDSAVTTWLHRVVVNACLDRLRRKAARPVADGASEQALDALVSAPAADGDVALDVAAALATLSHDQRAALVLVDMMGYPVAEAAEVLGVSAGTVKSRCARGRARLLPRLAHLRPASADARESAPRESAPRAGGERRNRGGTRPPATTSHLRGEGESEVHEGARQPGEAGGLA